MIANERQYQITKEEAAKFDVALARADEQSVDMHPVLRKAMRESLESQLHDLREELTAYETLRAGMVSVLNLDSLEELPDALIQARIAVGLTQRGLAERLGVKEQQIQRYEATRYAGASLRRVQEVAKALGVEVHERVLLPVPAREGGGSR